MRWMLHVWQFVEPNQEASQIQLLKTQVWDYFSCTAGIVVWRFQITRKENKSIDWEQSGNVMY